MILEMVGGDYIGEIPRDSCDESP